MVRPEDELGALGALVDEELLHDLERALVLAMQREVARARGERRPARLTGASEVLGRLEDLRRGLPEWALAPVAALSRGRASGRLVTLAELDTGLVAQSTVRRWCADGWVTARRVGRSWVVLLEDVEREARRRQG